MLFIILDTCIKYINSLQGGLWPLKPPDRSSQSCYQVYRYNLQYGLTDSLFVRPQGGEQIPEVKIFTKGVIVTSHALWLILITVLFGEAA